MYLMGRASEIESHRRNVLMALELGIIDSDVALAVLTELDEEEEPTKTAGDDKYDSAWFF
jgi:hypothetical protein